MRFFNYLLLILLLSFQSVTFAEQATPQTLQIAATASEHDGHQPDATEEGNHCKRDGGCCCKCCKKADATDEPTEKSSCCKDGCCCKSGCAKDGEKADSCHRKTSQTEHSDDAMHRAGYLTVFQQLQMI